LNKDTSSQRADIIIKLEQKLYIEKEEHSWILGNPKITLIKTGSSDTSTTIYIDT